MIKKLFLFFAIVLVIFTFASCKQDPKSEPGGNQGSSGDENGGVLTVSPASDAQYLDHTDRFQFLVEQEISAGDEITFLVKASDIFGSLKIRSGNGSAYTTFTTLTFSSETPDADGWYEASADATEDSDYIGFSAMLTGGASQTLDCFVSIKNLKINDVLIDFETFDEESCVRSLSNDPDKVSATITK